MLNRALLYTYLNGMKVQGQWQVSCYRPSTNRFKNVLFPVVTLNAGWSSKAPHTSTKFLPFILLQYVKNTYVQ